MLAGRFSGFLIVVLLAAFSCSLRMAEGDYIKVMSTLGCKMISEESPEAEKIYEEMRITAKDIANFRKKTSEERMQKIATTIAQKVASCFGIRR